MSAPPPDGVESMPAEQECPFPGMDPFFEGPFWKDFHDSLIPSIRDALMAVLPDRYVAVIERRLTVTSELDDRIAVSDGAILQFSEVAPSHPSGDRQRPHAAGGTDSRRVARGVPELGGGRRSLRRDLGSGRARDGHRDRGSIADQQARRRAEGLSEKAERPHRHPGPYGGDRPAPRRPAAADGGGAAVDGLLRVGRAGGRAADRPRAELEPPRSGCPSSTFR